MRRGEPGKQAALVEHFRRRHLSLPFASREFSDHVYMTRGALVALRVQAPDRDAASPSVAELEEAVPRGEGEVVHVGLHVPVSRRSVRAPELDLGVAVLVETDDRSLASFPVDEHEPGSPRKAQLEARSKPWFSTG